MNLEKKEQEINNRFNETKQLATEKERDINQKQKELDEILMEITRIQGEYRLIQEMKYEEENEKYDEGDK